MTAQRAHSEPQTSRKDPRRWVIEEALAPWRNGPRYAGIRSIKCTDHQVRTLAACEPKERAASDLCDAMKAAEEISDPMRSRVWPEVTGKISRLP